MSESGIDAYRTASVLGYCLLPLVLLSMISVVVSLECVPCPLSLGRSRADACCSGTLGYLLSCLSIAWCSYSASSIFSSVLRLSSQRFLVAYPVGLLLRAFRPVDEAESMANELTHCYRTCRYAAFAMLSVFDGRSGVVSVKD
jgi:hypothetical protein